MWAETPLDSFCQLHQCCEGLQDIRFSQQQKGNGGVAAGERRRTGSAVSACCTRPRKPSTRCLNPAKFL